MVCSHLSELEDALAAAGCEETFRGQAWSNNCREWVYYNCVLAACVSRHTNDDPKSGHEAGFVCEQCHDAIMGLHPADGAGKRVFPDKS